MPSFVVKPHCSFFVDGRKILAGERVVLSKAQHRRYEHLVEFDMGSVPDEPGAVKPKPRVVEEPPEEPQEPVTAPERAVEGADDVAPASGSRRSRRRRASPS